METLYCKTCTRRKKTGDCEEYFGYDITDEDAGCDHHSDYPVRNIPTDGLPDFMHRHCSACRIRTICDWTRVCGSKQKRLDYHTDVDLTINPAVDFDLNELKHFKTKMNFAVLKCYEYTGDGDPEIDIKCRFSNGMCKWGITVTLPDKIKLPGDATAIIRENGTIRIEKPAQAGLFEK